MIRHPLPTDLRGKEKLWTIGNKELDVTQLVILMSGIIPASILGGVIGLIFKNIIPTLIILGISFMASYIIAFVKVPGHTDMSIIQYFTRKNKCKKQTKILYNRRLSIQNYQQNIANLHETKEDDSVTLQSIFKLKK